MSTRPGPAVLVASVRSTLIFTPADLPVGQNDAKHLPDLLCAAGLQAWNSM
jgi:hypothetical protein